MDESTGSQSPPSFYSPARLGPILFLTLLFFLTFIGRVVLSPLMPSISSELHLTHSQAGAMFFLLSLGYFIALLSSGLVAARITHKHTILLATTFVGVALILAGASRGLLWLEAAVFFLGMAAGLYLPSGMTTLTDMVDPKDWGKAVSIHEIAPNLAFVGAPLLAELVMLWFPWRAVPAALGTCCLLISTVYARFGKWGRFRGSPPRLRAIAGVLSKPYFWIMVLLFGLAISSTMGVYTMLPLYLTESIGMGRPFANTIIGFSRVAGMATALASGWATDRYGARRTMICALGLTGVSTMALGATRDVPLSALMVFVQAVLATLYFPAGFTALSSLFPSGVRNVAISLTIPAAFVFGAGLVPSMIGYMGDLGIFAAGFAITGALVLAGSLLPLLLKLRPPDK
jgi:NNP family nitrate/nitrite transporter-like MFS transporter